jgi:hypothetical protein
MPTHLCCARCSPAVRAPGFRRLSAALTSGPRSRLAVPALIPRARPQKATNRRRLDIPLRPPVIALVIIVVVFLFIIWITELDMVVQIPYL